MITVEKHWERFFRWGPYGLLALGAVLTFSTRDELMTPAEQRTAVPIAVTALVLQLLWSTHRIPGHTYYLLRTVAGFILSWLNPFFAIYAVIGYFDARWLLPHRWAVAGAVVTAVTMAGSQAGGLPPKGLLGWAVYGGLFLLNGLLVLVIGDLSDRDARQSEVQKATIDELERTNARLEQAMRENAGLQAQLLVQAREAGVSDERRRLAAEIHDTIAQGLAGIITQLQAAADTTDPATSRGHVERAAALARESLNEARRSVHDLAPSPLEHATLPEALKKIVNAHPAARLTVTGTVEPLHDEIEATLLRIAQEALANAVRHAAAGRIGVTLSYMDDEVTLDVRDDGRGFSRPTRGFGLNGMRERAERVLGTLEIESEPGQGTAVSARVPLISHG
ncbi:sensor histidine kinase [Actinomadura viridis]|uniref:Signal transduction histidine kinase n=1 Tax=Actinomadura viridis TaxID=58110 RepID=A0A931DP95_9ACTN|nr:sensor histidine kinase [Actinomadura viridis]MBG6092203.1 signal transduction histidine kinase [Actinomadura viridis]